MFLVYAGLHFRDQHHLKRPIVARVDFARFCEQSDVLSISQEAMALGHVVVTTVNLENPATVAKLIHPGLIGVMNSGASHVVLGDELHEISRPYKAEP